jgi:hypothetical protein
MVDVEESLTCGTCKDPAAISAIACCTNGTRSLGQLAEVTVQAYNHQAIKNEPIILQRTRQRQAPVGPTIRIGRSSAGVSERASLQEERSSFAEAKEACDVDEEDIGTRGQEGKQESQDSVPNRIRELGHAASHKRFVTLPTKWSTTKWWTMPQVPGMTTHRHSLCPLTTDMEYLGWFFSLGLEHNIHRLIITWKKRRRIAWE